MTLTDRRTVLKTLATGTLLATGAGTVAAAGKGKRQGASADPTIADIAGGDDFTTLLGALQATGLDDVLAANGRQYTVFAPTNDAFASVDTSGLTTDQLANVLLYHVTSGRRYANSVVNAPQLKMLNGGTVSVDGTTLNDGQANIDATDIEASNGVVHVINGVLLP